MNDQQAIDRYRYMLRTAPPDDIERAHVEAFEQLSPEQRRVVLSELSKRVPSSEVGDDDPRSLARMATRAEMREPGTMERTFGGVSGPGLGSMFFATIAGAFVGSAIADAFFDNETNGSADGRADGEASDEPGGEVADGDAGGDFGGGDFGGGDFGGF